jgi:adenosylhomocysteine nucleosidase
LQIRITFALENEFAPWKKLRSFRQVAYDPCAVYEARIGNALASVLVTGVGSENACRALRSELTPADVLISTGLAGSLKPDLKPSDILAATSVRDSQGRRQIESDAALLELAVLQGARCVAKFWTAGAIIRTATQKRSMGLEADAVEMESFALLAEAKALHVPAVAIRAVSDAVDEDLPLNFDGIADERGRIRVTRVVSRLAQAPHRFPALLRLGKQSRRAAE